MKDERILKKVDKLLKLYGVEDDEREKFLLDLKDKKYDDQEELEEVDETEDETIEEPAEKVEEPMGEDLSADEGEVEEQPAEEPVGEEDGGEEVGEEVEEQPQEELPAEQPVEQPVEEQPVEQPVEHPNGNDITILNNNNNGDNGNKYSAPLRFPCGTAEKPEWMTDELWGRIKFRTATNIPGIEQGFYDTYIEYVEELHKQGKEIS